MLVFSDYLAKSQGLTPHLNQHEPGIINCNSKSQLQATIRDGEEHTQSMETKKQPKDYRPPAGSVVPTMEKPYSGSLQPRGLRASLCSRTLK